MLHASEPCQQGPISVVWVMRDQIAGSHLWSGWDICDGINGNHANGSKRFPDIVCLALLWGELESKSNEQVLELFRKEGQPPEKRNVDLCVLLKLGEPEVVKRCRKLGAKTALAYVDKHPNLMQEGGIQNYSRSGFDHVVVPNTLMSQHHTQALGGSRVWVIPQQNPNVNRVIKTNTADPVHVVAWQGSPENRMSAEVRDAITAWTLRNPGIEFREIFYFSANQSRAGQEQARDQAFNDVVRQADILVIFPPENNSVALEVYKPSGRNLFALSMGIPSILMPYVSYTEDNKWGANYPAFASNIPQLLRWLDILRDSAEARVTLSQMGLAWADHFSVDHIALYPPLAQCPTTFPFTPFAVVAA